MAKRKPTTAELRQLWLESARRDREDPIKLQEKREASIEAQVKKAQLRIAESAKKIKRKSRTLFAVTQAYLKIIATGFPRRYESQAFREASEACNAACLQARRYGHTFKDIGRAMGRSTEIARTRVQYAERLERRENEPFCS